MHEESIEEKSRRFRDGRATVQELTAVLGPWLDRVLAGERGSAAGYGSGRRDDAAWVVREYVGFLEGEGARGCGSLFGKLRSIVKRRADIRRNLVSLREVEPFLPGPKGDGDRRFEDGRSRADWADEAALDFETWRETFNEVWRHHDDVSNFLKAAGTGHPLWQVYAAFTWKNYREFLIVAHRLAGQRPRFPTPKSLQNATIGLEIGRYLDSTISMDDLTARLNAKYGRGLSEQTVGKWRRRLRERGPVDAEEKLERENADRDMLLKKFSKIRLAKKGTTV